MALEPEDNETKALAPISKITMVTAIDFYAGKITFTFNCSNAQRGVVNLPQLEVEFLG